MSTAQFGLYATLTPLIAASIGAIVVFLRRTRTYRQASSRSSSARAEIDRILLEAKIREAQERQAAAEKPEAS
jgi:hypothetical protein